MFGIDERDRKRDKGSKKVVTMVTNLKRRKSGRKGNKQMIIDKSKANWGENGKSKKKLNVKVYQRRRKLGYFKEKVMEYTLHYWKT